jgi:hypothetical protein
MYKHIQALMAKESITAEERAVLDNLTSEFSAMLSADYMMGKNLPYWGDSAQPRKTYYMMKPAIASPNNSIMYSNSIHYVLAK